MPLDPQAEAYLARMAALGLRPVDQLTPEEARAQTEAGADALFGPREPVASVQDVEVEGVPVRLYTPVDRPGLPMLVYAHGGGWVVASLETHDGVCRALANRSGCRVASVGYRLAPRHRFPAAVEDCWAVTRWAFEQAPAVAVAGDSAGGNLAAVVALRARDQGLPLALQVLVYPVVDPALATESMTANATGYGLTRDAMRWYWDHYLGDGERAHPEANLARATSLAGAAPALVVVCEYDVLRDEAIEYAARLREAGVRVRLSEYEGMVHGIIRTAAHTDRTQDLLDEVAAAVREAVSAG
jgi:acetyl esterase